MPRSTRPSDLSTATLRCGKALCRHGGGNGIGLGSSSNISSGGGDGIGGVGSSSGNSNQWVPWPLADVAAALADGSLSKRRLLDHIWSATRPCHRRTRGGTSIACDHHPSRRKPPSVVMRMAKGERVTAFVPSTSNTHGTGSGLLALAARHSCSFAARCRASSVRRHMPGAYR